MKDAYYFPHDSNAHRDPKCSALINDFGVKGYGLYWAIIEILHEQREGKLEKFPKLYEGLAFQLKITKEELIKLLEALLQDYKLLEADEKHIWSNRVLRNLEERKVKYQIKVEAGRIGGVKSGESRRKNLLEAVLEANEQKERKGKESKVKENSTDFISSLKSNPAYQHINLDIELGKMDAWLLANSHRKKTKRFVVNWLNKIEKPLLPQARRP